MKFELALNLDNVPYYGNVPDFFDCTDKKSEIFTLEPSDWPLLNSDFIDPINEQCETLLDYGDIDFLDVDQCKLLNKWLSDRLSRNCNTRLRVLYEKLQEFATRAIALGTGIVVEL